MEFFCDGYEFDAEFHFALEMVILTRHEEGATISEIHDDFEKHFGIRFESIWGYKSWSEHIRTMLSNIMVNISSKTLGTGCFLYYMNIDAAIEKLSNNLSENMAFVVSELDINENKLIEIRNANKRLQSGRWYDTSNSDSMKNAYPRSTSSVILPEECEISGHSIIGDDFFLDLVFHELNYRQNSKKRIRQIGQCISGQTILKAVRNLPRVVNDLNDGVIVNLGSIDLLQGRELVDMLSDMSKLCDIFYKCNIFPIFTTIPPLGNQRHNSEMERKRKAFNKYLLNQFDCIDIEHCFLNKLNQIIFDLYRHEPKLVSGTQRAILPWNRSGLQRVVKVLEKSIPDFYNNQY